MMISWWPVSINPSAALSGACCRNGLGIWEWLFPLRMGCDCPSPAVSSCQLKHVSTNWDHITFCWNPICVLWKMTLFQFNSPSHMGPIHQRSPWILIEMIVRLHALFRMCWWVMVDDAWICSYERGQYVKYNIYILNTDFFNPNTKTKIPRYMPYMQISQKIQRYEFLAISPSPTLDRQQQFCINHQHTIQGISGRLLSGC